MANLWSPLLLALIWIGVHLQFIPTLTHLPVTQFWRPAQRSFALSKVLFILGLASCVPMLWFPDFALVSLGMMIGHGVTAVRK